ncbi:MAG: hypothetical protein HN590_08375 [Calditrichaeota bacterium]|nr:hypothetical protein [Calditrichota bacterium]
MRSRFTFIALLSVVLLVGMFTGCDEGEKVANIGGVDPNIVTGVEIRATHILISGLIDEQRTEQITAIAVNAAGVGVPGVQIQFGIENPQSYKGNISVALVDSVTNQNGQLAATYSVVLAQDADVKITATTGQVRGEKTIQLRVRTDVGTPSVEVLKPVLTVPPGQTRNTQITATLVDENGLALPGVQLYFRTDPPTLGYVDSDTAMTDNSGRAVRTFTSIVNQYGQCDVIVSVNNDNSARTKIEVRPVAGPSKITAHAEPERIKVGNGGNAQSDVWAVVTDSTGVGVPLTTVLFEIQSDGAAPIFGSLTSSDSSITNSDGEIHTTFNSRGGYGSQWIVAKVVPSGLDGEAGADQSSRGKLNLKIGDDVVAGFDEELQARVLLTIEPIEDQPRFLSLSATPAYFNIPVDTTGQSIIRATIRDENNNGIPNLQVDFRSSIGTIAQPTITDSAGIATAQYFIRPATDMDPPNEADFAKITATIPGTNWEKDVDIEIIPAAHGVGSLTLTTDRSFIWADGDGLSFANLTAVLQDADGQILTGEEIVFTSSFNFSVVQSPVFTDTIGRAKTVFDDNGRPSVDERGMPDSVTVTAKYNPMGLTTVVRIMIRERNPVTRIDLNASARQLTANSGDSTAVRATCYLSNGSPAPAGTIVFFDQIYGSYSEAVVPVSGSAGAAETYYIAGNQVRTDTLIAYVQTPQDTAYSNEQLIDLVSGPPSIIVVHASPNELLTNDPAAACTITATVMDTSSNPVRQGTFVTYSTTLGTIGQSAVTDINGDAVVLLNPGVQSGLAVITASVDGGGGPITAQATVNFIAGTPNSIELDADPLQIQVRGTGGVQTSTLRATVRDANGNLIMVPTPVVFELINEPNIPAGCTIGNEFDQSFASMTSGGIAVATLNSGEQIGGKLIRAYTWRDSAARPDDRVTVTLSTVAVVSGPPFQLDIDVNDEGEDAGGGAWQIEVSARVWDIHRNPVANRIPVVFTVEPEIANIEAAWTGNLGAAGTAVQGLAYAALVYNSVNTFDAIEISAEVQTERGQIQGSREHTLPLQEGVLELNVDPGNWMFTPETDQADIRVWAVLTDGHQIRINNAPILFTSNRARFWWKDFSNDRFIMFFPDASRKYTGIVDRQNNEAPGVATVYLRAEVGDIFLDPFTLEVTVQINGSVEGYNDVQADPGFIFFTNPAE